MPDATIPHLADLPAYANDPIHAADPDAPDPAALTPLEELAVEHVFGGKPFIIEATLPGIGNFKVHFRILKDWERLAVNDGADEAKAPANTTVLERLHTLTRAVVDLDGNPPLPEDAKEDTLAARFQYFSELPAPTNDLLYLRLAQSYALYRALVMGESIPK